MSSSGGKRNVKKITGNFIKGCAGKIQHKTYLSAEFYLDSLHSNSDADIYECSECGFFHIGTQSKNKKRTGSKNKKKLLIEGNGNKGNNKEQHKRKHKRFKY
jgi:hypothetical protein